MVRDLQGLALREERLDGSRSSWSYDASANVTRYTDYDGSSWRFSYVSWNRLHQIVSPLGTVTEITHSPRLMPVRVIDPSQVTTEYAYDLRNRLTGVARDGVVRETYTYDASDELAEKRDGLGQWLLRFEREDDGRKVTRSLASGERHDIEYTPERRVKSATVTDDKGKQDAYAFAYDIWDNRTRDERNGLGVQRRFAESELTEVRVLGRFVIRYERSQRGMLSIIDPTGAKHVVQVCQGGVVRRRMSNGTTEVAQFHPEGYCLAKLAYAGTEQRWSRFYERSNDGDVRAIHDNVRGVHRFTYDAAHRLVGELLPSGQSQSFTYTAGDDLIDAPGLRGVNTHRHKLIAANDSRFEYDHRGQLVARHTPHGTLQLRRDAMDNMVLMHGPWWGTWTARYDVLSRRIEATFNGATTQFYWDTDRLAAEILPDQRLRVYVYADHLALTPLMFVDYENASADPASGKRYFVLANHLGAPEVIQDDAGTVVWRARYEAYGTAHIDIGTEFHQPLRWPGHYFDTATGLHYVRFRYYSPELGRFIESDPQGIAGGFNLHGYALGNPLRYVDVQGLAAECPGDPSKKKKDEDKALQESQRIPKPGGDPNAPKKGDDPVADHDGLTSKQRAYFRSQIDNAPNKTAASQARFNRNCCKRDNAGHDHMDPKPWKDSANQAHENGHRGGKREAKALDDLGLDNNNNANPPKTYPNGHDDEGNPRVTRPDADNDKAVVDVKSAPDDPEKPPAVVHNEQQLRAQQEGAGDRDHVTVISNNDRDKVRPSKPLADSENGGSDHVLHHKSDSDPPEFSRWDKNANDGKGAWEDLPTDQAREIVGGRP